jgi:methylated-DNA-[protein]-cysteine S-methyltransferase
MTDLGYSLFDTAIGRCAIAWSVRGVLCVQLPEATVRETRTRIQSRYPGAREQTPPHAAGRAIDGIVAVLNGERRHLDEVELDMTNVPPFHRRVYQVARTIAPGSTCSYGQIAKHLGVPGAARAVGQALGRNPFAIIVPCHRVLASSGKLCGFSASGGIATKARLLTIEGTAAATDSHAMAV